VYLPLFKYLAILPTGNCNPALADLDYYLDAVLPLAFPFPVEDILLSKNLKFESFKFLLFFLVFFFYY